MEQSEDALSLKDAQLVCLLYYLSLSFRQTLSNLFIFLCDTFPAVLIARLLVFDKTNKIAIRLNLKKKLSATFFSFCVVG